MLPSKGFFATHYCPFFEQGSCERPYCHFHHKKKTKSSEIGRWLEASTSIQANHVKALEEFEEINQKLNIKVRGTKYSSNIYANGNVLTYTPTPIAILKKRNTTGCNNHKQGIDEEIMIKKQKTQICNRLESGNDSDYLKQNIERNEKPVNCELVSNHDEESLKFSNILEMSSNKIYRPILGNSHAEGIPFKDNTKSCEQKHYCTSPIHALKPDNTEYFLNFSTNPYQTNFKLAGGESQTETNTATNNSHSTETNLCYSNATKNITLGPHGESLLNNILEGKINEKNTGHCDDEFTIENNINECSYKNESTEIYNLCIPINETISNNKQFDYMPRETYANIVKQERNFCYSNNNKSQYSLETCSKVEHFPVSIERSTINNNNTTVIDDNTRENTRNYAKTNNQSCNGDRTLLTQVNHCSSYNYSTPSSDSPPLLDEKSCNNLILDEKVSHLETSESQSSIIQSINIKHRIAHSDSTEKIKGISPNEAPKVLSHCSPSQVLLERWKTANVLLTKKNNDVKETAPKMRIAYVPNVAALLAERQRITNSLAKSRQIKGRDLSSSVSCEGVSILKRDFLVESVPNSKIPIIKRQTFLNKALEIYSQLYSYDTAKSKAADAEKDICSTSKTSTTYFNRFAQLFMRLKKEIAAKNNLQKTTTENMQFPKTIEANRISLYKDFLKYITYDLEDNGIPVPHPEKSGFARMKKIYGVSSYNKSKSICIYCLKEFEVDSNGYSIEKMCRFHSGKMYKQIRKYGIEKIWTCCNGDEESGGCIENELHVRDMVDYDNIAGFKQVREPTVSLEEACQVYAMDCEMCYTTEGSELTRCTVVDMNLKVIYDKLCVPDLPIIDYCTKFSGISKGDLDNVSTKLSDIQTDLLNLFTTKTILIGHGIGNDLKAVKLFHRSIIDTNEVYGNFRKHKLSELTREILQREIQVSGSGHNSCEDAIATMELMLVKVKEDRKASMLRSRTHFNVGLNKKKLINNIEK